jgi:hypothetical protein
MFQNFVSLQPQMMDETAKHLFHILQHAILAKYKDVFVFSNLLHFLSVLA